MDKVLCVCVRVRARTRVRAHLYVCVCVCMFMFGVTSWKNHYMNIDQVCDLCIVSVYFSMK